MPDPVTGDATYPFSFLCRRRNDAETLAAAFEVEPAASVESLHAGLRLGTPTG